MTNYDNEVFGFGSSQNEFEDQQPSNENFSFDSISGLGQSDYENEDLFKIEDNNIKDSNLEYKSFHDNNISFQNEMDTNDDLASEFMIDDNFPYSGELENVSEFSADTGLNSVDESPVETEIESAELAPLNQDETVTTVNESDFEENLEQMDDATPVIEKTDDSAITQSEESSITMSDTPIDDLQDLTKYNSEEVESTDIKSLFDRVNINVKEASDIFRKNTEMKDKIDTRFDELKKLQSEIEKAKQRQIDEVNNYKEEVLEQLTSKKEEIEKRLNTLKEVQATLEREKEEFELHKKQEKENIEKVQKEVQAAYDDRREELNKIEGILRKQKDALDNERSQLVLDKIQYEADKNELANNLLKFNELVDSFTNGVNNVGE